MIIWSGKRCNCLKMYLTCTFTSFHVPNYILPFKSGYLHIINKYEVQFIFHTLKLYLKNNKLLPPILEFFKFKCTVLGRDNTQHVHCFHEDPKDVQTNKGKLRVAIKSYCDFWPIKRYSLKSKDESDGHLCPAMWSGCNPSYELSWFSCRFY